ncbi:MAG: alpha/beta hydrolase [Ruminococcus sp.]|uniref:alpha/beta fold hydrolase n=1 Tax=Ruminococcus sp. TaxID=41978 RepID=UPI0025CDFF00|nr:alpha/beta hydrolase [Ruminococcus sp.]MCR4795283.1 alpha/beta hydrolase [Ruminococcus sp.]
MSYFTFDGKNVFYEESGVGTPLLLMHGNTASSKMYNEISKRYASDFNVIMIDFLGHGRSDRLSEFPTDLWFYEAQQVISFLRYKDYKNVYIIGSSGGAIVALNVALEAPELVGKIIADSFEGEKADKRFTRQLIMDRNKAVNDDAARGFFEYMHGSDWKNIVENDTEAIIRHEKEIGNFFHKPLSELKADLMLTGSKKDSFMYKISDNYYETVYSQILKQIPHGKMHLFESGDHPAFITNSLLFYDISMDFFN